MQIPTLEDLLVPPQYPAVNMLNVAEENLRKNKPANISETSANLLDNCASKLRNIKGKIKNLRMPEWISYLAQAIYIASQNEEGMLQNKDGIKDISILVNHMKAHVSNISRNVPPPKYHPTFITVTGKKIYEGFSEDIEKWRLAKGDAITGNSAAALDKIEGHFEHHPLSDLSGNGHNQTWQKIKYRTSLIAGVENIGTNERLEVSYLSELDKNMVSKLLQKLREARGITPKKRVWGFVVENMPPDLESYFRRSTGGKIISYGINIKNGTREVICGPGIVNRQLAKWFDPDKEITLEDRKGLVAFYDGSFLELSIKGRLDKKPVDWHPAGVYLGPDKLEYIASKSARSTTSLFKKGNFEMRLFKLGTPLTLSSTNLLTKAQGAHASGKYIVDIFIGSHMTKTLSQKYVRKRFGSKYIPLYYATESERIYCNENNPAATYFREWIKPDGEPKTFKDLLALSPVKLDEITFHQYYDIKNNPWLSFDHTPPLGDVIQKLHPSKKVIVNEGKGRVYLIQKNGR